MSMKVVPASFRTLAALVALALFMFANVILIPVYAATNCLISTDKPTVAPGSINEYTFTISHNGPEPIQWIDISVPSAKFTYLSNSITGWTTFNHTKGVTLEGGSIAPRETASFRITVAAGVEWSDAAKWKVQVSANINGDGSDECLGDPTTAIQGNPPNTSPTVNNLLVSDITQTSANISWDSDFATNGIVYYGKTSTYSHASTFYPSRTSHHSITLTGLDVGSGYHFQVIGVDALGNAAYSTDSTFVTSSVSYDSDTDTETDTPDISEPSTIIVDTPGDTSDLIAPIISISPISADPYLDPPQFSGEATDNVAIQAVDYSTDGGRNWLPADLQASPPNTQIAYSFTPTLSQDGNYQILARATDTTGNTSTTASQLLIIDRLKPSIGGGIISTGPQIVYPDENGTIMALSGIDMKITLSAVGGPTAIAIKAVSEQGDANLTQNFSMTFVQDTGLWVGLLSFAKTGVYRLTATGVDGANNITTKTLHDVDVSDAGLTYDSKTREPISSEVTIFYKEPESQDWVIWDGEAFGQTNPTKTDDRPDKVGRFSRLLPAGTYYIEAANPDYHTHVSNIFTLDKPTPLTTELGLTPLNSLKLGSLNISAPSFSVYEIDFKPTTESEENMASLKDKAAPEFLLGDTAGASRDLAGVIGNPSIIYFDSMWSPTSIDQMETLSRLQSDDSMNVIPIAMQDSRGRVQSYVSRSGTDLLWLIDSVGATGASYGVSNLSSYYFLDRNGTVRHTYVGVLSEEQIRERIADL